MGAIKGASVFGSGVALPTRSNRVPDNRQYGGTFSVHGIKASQASRSNDENSAADLGKVPVVNSLAGSEVVYTLGNGESLVLNSFPLALVYYETGNVKLQIYIDDVGGWRTIGTIVKGAMAMVPGGRNARLYNDSADSADVYLTQMGVDYLAGHN